MKLSAADFAKVARRRGDDLFTHLGQWVEKGALLLLSFTARRFE
jgi:hypothetical protein